MTKREAVLNLLDADSEQTYTPAGFFIHFDKSCHRGQAAIDKHLEFFRHTGMDFMKIQYENIFPHRAEIKKPEDWYKMPMYGRDFYEDHLNIVKSLIAAAKDEALVIMTLYSPFMCAGHTIGSQELDEHIRQNPDAAKKGIEIITESLLLFVKECIGLGVDGFYASTQGRESFRFADPALFDECIKPYDLVLMEEMNRCCSFNILHICDYHGGYDDLTPFLDYPGQVINCSLELDSRTLASREISSIFSRPFMGGVDRKGIVACGSDEEIKKMVEEVIAEAPDKFILGADCTLPGDINWDNIKTAITAAHRAKQ